MKRLLLQHPWFFGCVPAIVLVGTLFALTAGAQQAWVTLFDGAGLDHWTMSQPGGWKVEEGCLTAQPIRKNNNLWTKRAYRDFALALEFKMTAQCNSGVFFRSDPDNPVQGGFEIQIFDSHGKTEIDRHDCGALYDAQAPGINAAKPAGEWNQLQITCKGPAVTVELNGKKVVEADLDRWVAPNKNPDGTKNKFNTALKDLPRSGHVGLQYHGHPIWFRNVKIKPLD